MDPLFQSSTRPQRKAYPPEAGAFWPDFSPREQQIAYRIKLREPHKAIARELGMSPKTLATYIARAAAKIPEGLRREIGGSDAEVICVVHDVYHGAST
jgi:DNA-binding CsgD family transcriptional regulator